MTPPSGENMYLNITDDKAEGNKTGNDNPTTIAPTPRKFLFRNKAMANPILNSSITVSNVKARVIPTDVRKVFSEKILI
jgi:hypothetical protein